MLHLLLENSVDAGVMVGRGSCRAASVGAIHYAEKACSAQGIRYWPVQRIDGKLCATERGLTKTIMSKQVLAIRGVSFAGSINQISVTFTL